MALYFSYIWPAMSHLCSLSSPSKLNITNPFDFQIISPSNLNTTSLLNSTMPPPPSHWEPCEALDVDPSVGAAFTYTGTTKEGQRCRKLVNKPDRAKATALLEKLSRVDIFSGNVDIHGAEFRGKLAAIAERTTCLNYHHHGKLSKVQEICDRWIETEAG